MKLSPVELGALLTAIGGVIIAGAIFSRRHKGLLK